ncbi:DUF6508 domain-containing protein [Parabacteroides sp. OttesenSCG-928-J18]|nr:DUF6508 domain-containing protein [Parabacteroides sp. OttesenSCG-928-J18]
MIHRSIHLLTEKILEENPVWWNTLKSDPEIYIEIRKNGCIDAYYRGGAIVKDLHWSDQKGFSAKIHAKYLKDDTESSKYEDCPLDFLSDQLIKIKERISKRFPLESEKAIQANLILNQHNHYIDSEFQASITNERNETEDLRIDLVKLSGKKRIVFQELKRIDDNRLLKIGTNRSDRELHKIKSQMVLYSKFLSENKAWLFSYYVDLITVKKKLGLNSIPFRVSFGDINFGNFSEYDIDINPQLVISDYNEAYAEESKKGERVKSLIKMLDIEGINYYFTNINVDGYLYKRHILSLTKNDWDSIFDMIPWIERIDKIDPNETYTDRGGERTRPRKYVEYKSASVQLIPRISKLLMPFDWKNWEEGKRLLKEESFSEIDVQTTCKLLTVLLYYKETLDKTTLLGTPCNAQDLDDGRVLKLLKQLKYCMEYELRNELEKHNAYYSQDSKFAGYARLLQSKWREKKGYPIGKSSNGTEYGNYIEATVAEKDKVNLLTDKIRSVAAIELAKKKNSGALIEEKRLWTNALSSQPLCFNLFGELADNTELATTFFKQLFPGRINAVKEVLFEYSPGRGNKNYTGDRSAFDVFVRYTSNEGKKGFIGIEVKYAETLKEGAANVDKTFNDHQTEYLRLATEDIFKQDNIGNLKKSPLFQIWRDHLLSISLLKNKDFDEGFFVFLFPKGNTECRQGVDLYCQQLTHPYKWDEEKSGFYWRFLDDFINTLHDIVNEEWTKELKERYLGT